MMGSATGDADATAPFRLVERRPGRPTATKVTATSLLLLKDETVVVGTADGQVILTKNGNGTDEPIVTILKAKRPVSKLLGHVFGDCFLALCGGELFILDIKTLNRRQPFQNLRGIADISVTKQETSAMLLLGILVATQNGSNQPDDGILHLFSGYGIQLEKLRDIPLRDSVGFPTQASWCSSTMICVGGTKSAALVDIKGVIRKIPIVVDAKRGPIILSLPQDRVLLSSAGGIGVVVDLQGYPDPNAGTIVWSSSPVALVCSGPYIISLADNGCLEIAPVDSPGTIIQSTTVSSFSETLASDVSFTISIESEFEWQETLFSFVVGLSNQYSDVPFRQYQALPLQDRITDLLKADSGDCTRAMALVRESFAGPHPPSISAFLNERARHINTAILIQAAGIILATRSEYDRAFALLATANADPTMLLSFGGYSPVPSITEPIQQQAYDYLLSVINEMDLFKDQLFRSNMNEYVMKMRRAIRQTSSSQPLMPVITESAQDMDNAILFFLADTANPKQVEEFCLDPTNRCDVLMCVKRLKELGLSLAAAHLLSKGQRISPEAARAYVSLNQPQHFCQIFINSSKDDQNSAVAYDIFTSNLDWMLTNASSTDYEQVLTKFASALFPGLQEIPESKFRIALRPSVLVASMYQAKFDEDRSSVDPAVFGRSLVSALEELISFDEKRDLYSARLLQLIELDTTAARAALDALTKSKFSSRLGRERAGCLGVLGRHREALRILINELSDYEGAERYCELHQPSKAGWSEADSAGSSPDPFAALLAIHLERFSEGSSGPRAEAALAFLARHSSRVNPLDALQALPETLPLSHALRFLEQAINRVSHDRRESRIERNLALAESLQVKLKLLTVEEEHFVVTPETTCSFCGKGVGISAIIRDPNGSIKHAEPCRLRVPALQAVGSLSSRGRLTPASFDDDPSEWKRLA